VPFGASSGSQPLPRLSVVCRSETTVLSKSSTLTKYSPHEPGGELGMYDF
jgi:hypothetical protein